MREYTIWRATLTGDLYEQMPIGIACEPIKVKELHKERPDKYTIARIERLTSENDKLKELCEKAMRIMEGQGTTWVETVECFRLADKWIEAYEDFKKGQS